jgi:hypothetical protein
MRELEHDALSVSLGGFFRGRDLSGEATIVVHGDIIELERGARTLRIPLAAVEGARMRDDILELFLDGGDVVEVSGADELPALARRIEKRACVVPELTRSLKAFGSRRAFPGAEHDLFFAPLLEARRRSERSLGPTGLRDAFDARPLREEIEEVLRALAASHHPRHAPDRRALQAELREAASSLLRSVDDMGVAQGRVEDSDGADRIARWREWTLLVRELFVRADATWLAIHALLAGAPPRRRGWRRWLGRG